MEVETLELNKKISTKSFGSYCTVWVIPLFYIEGEHKK